MSLDFSAIYYEAMKGKKADFYIFPDLNSGEIKEFLLEALNYISNNRKRIAEKEIEIENFRKELLQVLNLIKENKLKLQYSGSESSMDDQDRKDKEEREELLDSYISKVFELISKSYENYYNSNKIVR